LQRLARVIDGRVGGRGGLARRLHGRYTGRALPVAWLVRRGRKGHLPEHLPIARVEQGQEMIPLGVPVVWRGAGVCDGTGRPQTVHEVGWCSVCRPGSHRTASWAGETGRLDTVGVCSPPGPLVDFPEVLFTGEA
jgi:hypothetical protein